MFAFDLACSKTLKLLAAKLVMRILVYIDDILILAESRTLAQDHVIDLILTREPRLCGKPNSVLEPTQSLEFLGFSFNSVHWKLSLLAGR